MGLRAPELIIILIVALLIFGPKNLPKLGKSLGQTVKNVRDGMEGDENAPKEVEAAKEDVVVETAAEKVIDAEPVAAAPAAAKEVVEAAAEKVADAEPVAAAPAAVEEEVVFCSKCGAKNAADAGFCNKCGEKLA